MKATDYDLLYDLPEGEYTGAAPGSTKVTNCLDLRHSLQ